MAVPRKSLESNCWPTLALSGTVKYMNEKFGRKGNNIMAATIIAAIIILIIVGCIVAYN